MKNQFVEIEPINFNRRAVWLNVYSIARIDEFKAGETTITLVCPEIDTNADDKDDMGFTCFTIQGSPEEFLERLEQR